MSLNSLWRDGLVSVNDRLRLRFKCKSYFTTILEFGVLDGISSENEQLSDHKFGNLTEWVNTCISEFSEYTPLRISAFKRVYHLPSRLNISALRKMQSLFGAEDPQEESLYVYFSELFGYTKYLQEKLRQNGVLFRQSNIYEKLLYCYNKKLLENKINESILCNREQVSSNLFQTQNAK